MIMKKAAVISLILLLGISLGTSGYLLMNQKKVEAELGNVREIVKTAGANEKKLNKTMIVNGQQVADLLILPHHFVIVEKH